MKRKTVVLAMSGGVDSSVAAYLLQKKGYNVIGLTFKLWDGAHCKSHEEKGCCSLDSINDARGVCEKFKIPHYVINHAKIFKEQVIDYFLYSYKQGLTPNPCIICNKKIKFPLLLEQARLLGADYIATGHYARCRYSRKSRRFAILEARDKNKDQSYVLFSMAQDALSRLKLPVGDYKKEAIRSIAKKLKLHAHKRAESQEICFIQDNDLKGFLRRSLGDKIKKGAIKDKTGKLLSGHDGTCFFTIGQRRGLKIPYGKPVYVTDINIETGDITIGGYKDTLREFTHVRDIHWIVPPIIPGRIKGIKVKIRYKHPKADAEIKTSRDNTALVLFREPQNAPTPGQAAVFYRKGTVIGGGWISKGLNKS